MHLRPLSALAFAALLLACGGDDPVTVTPDVTAPTVVAVTPQDGATAASIRTVVSIEFSEPVRTADPNAAVLQLRDERGAVATGSWIIAGRTSLIFTPADMLELGMRYTITLAPVLVDTAGNAVAGMSSWSFTVTGRQAPVLDETRLHALVEQLAHDSLAGRGSGTADELRAAGFLRAYLQAHGLAAGVPGYLQSFPIAPARVGGRTGVTSQNVIAALPGAGSLAQEWLVIGAHYDHVGMRAPAAGALPVPYNGADDNASGTALLLEIARLLATHAADGGSGGEPRRSLLFIAFGAEELGLLGSEYYCASGAHPMSAITAMINFDMVGRLRNDLLYVGGLASASEWRWLLARFNSYGLAIGDTDCAACTDFACFRRAQRPVLWFYTGTHPEYHTFRDDIELVDARGMSRIGNLATRTILHLAHRPRGFTFLQ